MTVASRDLNFLADHVADPGPGLPGAAGVGAWVGSRPVRPAREDWRVRFRSATVIFPCAGQYVVFVDFWPRGGDQVDLAVPVTVGSAKTPAATLTPDASPTQTVGDLRITLKPGAAAVPGPSLPGIRGRDAQGRVRTTRSRRCRQVLSPGRRRRSS